MKRVPRPHMILLLVMLPVLAARAQGVLIGPTDVAPDPSALLHLNAGPYIGTAKKGMLPPNVELQRTDQAAPLGPLPLPPSLLVYNTVSTNWPGNDAQFNVYPGFYSWDGARWLRFEAGVGRQVYVDCSDGNMGGTAGASITGTAWLTTAFATNLNRIGGLYSSGNPISLVAGDRVFFEASGGIRLSATGTDTARWTSVELQLVYTINTTATSAVNVLASTVVSLDTRSTGTTGSSFLFGLFSSSSTGYSQYASTQSWSLMGNLDVTVTNANYRIWVRARRLKAIGSATLITGTPGTELEGCLRTEVFRY